MKKAGANKKAAPKSTKSTDIAVPRTAPAPVAAVKDQHGIYTLNPSKPKEVKPENPGTAE
jgi:hypothetical protein